MLNLLKTQILERVDLRLKKLEMSDRAVSMKASGQPDVIRNWRNKDVLPRLDTLYQVATALETAPEWLVFGAGSESQLLIPKISWVSAGAFGSSEAITETDDFDYLPVAGLPEGDWVALEVVGDSMDRISPPESIILVNRRDRRLVQNACYVIQDGEGGATYKRYRQGPVRFEPVSTNAAHEPIFPDNDNMPTIFGRVGRSFINM